MLQRTAAREGRGCRKARPWPPRPLRNCSFAARLADGADVVAPCNLIAEQADAWWVGSVDVTWPSDGVVTATVTVADAAGATGAAAIALGLDTAPPSLTLVGFGPAATEVPGPGGGPARRYSRAAAPS